MFYQAEAVPSIPSLLRDFIMNRCWNLSNAKIVPIDIGIHFFLFQLDMVDYITLNQPCISGVNPSWLWYIILFIHWAHFATMLLRIFTSMFMSNNYLQFFFLVMSLSSFSTRVMIVSQGECSLFYFLEETVENWYYFPP